MTKRCATCQRLYDALKRIASYDTPERLRRTSEKVWGLDPEEAIEMAYDNVLTEAKRAIRGMRRPTHRGQGNAGGDA